ncbi:MAG: hypothetical protein V1848_03255 [Candidatus Magasanikbacteria bacterium]
MEQNPYTDIAPWEVKESPDEQKSGSSDISSPFTSSQKTGFIFLFIFALLILGVIFLQMQKNIFSPFTITTDVEETSDMLNEMDEQIRLQTTDTDVDGINDYDELNFYYTSPYLPDSDSDGIGDKAEIDAGTDPLCAEGEECIEVEGMIMTSSSLENTIDTISGNVFNPLDVLGVAEGESVDQVTKGDIYLFLDNPDEIRKAILASGQMDEQTLSQIDDETLMQFAREYYQKEVGELPSSMTSSTEEVSSDTNT